MIERSQSGDLPGDKISDEDIDEAKEHWQRNHGKTAKAGEGPLSHVNFTIGTMHPDDQEVVRSTLGRLAAKYPEAAQEIRTVAASRLTTRWGSFSQSGKMQLSNIGGKYGDEYHDPNLDSTVAHEFGHAMIQHLAGGNADLREPPPRWRRKPDSTREDLERHNERMRAWNKGANDLDREGNAVARRMYDPVKAEHGDDAGSLYTKIVGEFAEHPHYVVGSPHEFLADAFGHHETGRHGPLADTVGKAFEDAYAQKHPKDEAA